MPYLIEPMTVDDISEVSDIEKVCFSTTWSAHSYRREITENRMARYVVARWDADQRPRTSFDLTELAAGAPRDRTGQHGPGLVRDVLRSINRLFGNDSNYVVPAHQLGGYAGIWLMFDEAHVTTIGVRPQLRRSGLGILLMLALYDLSVIMGAERMTLEVRQSNTGAQDLYKKFGFTEQGIRPRYYSDNREDALIMTTDNICTPAYCERVEAIRLDVGTRIVRSPLPPPLELATM